MLATFKLLTFDNSWVYGYMAIVTVILGKKIVPKLQNFEQKITSHGHHPVNAGDVQRRFRFPQKGHNL